MLFRSKDIIRSFTLHGGLQHAAHSLAGLPEIELRTGIEVRSIQQNGRLFELTTAAGEVLQCEQLTLATPPGIAGSLLTDVDEALSGTLNEVKSVNINSTGVVVRKENTSLPPVAGLIGLDDVFYSAVSRDIVSHPHYRGFSFHFPQQVDEGDRIKTIESTLGTADFEAVFHISHKLPSPRAGHHELVERITNLADTAQITLVGNYFEGLAIEDCVQQSFQRAARLLGAS